MRLVYEASNSVEGHMLVDLLRRAGLDARMDGEYLQGGLGELQAMGLVRVLVAEEDYEQARKVLSEWDEQQSGLEPAATIPDKKSSYLPAVLSFIAGCLLTTLYFYGPSEVDGVDYNQDGVLDEHWVYRNDTLFRVEVDRNLDGKLDLIQKYSTNGSIDSAVADNNFDGRYETDMEFHNGDITKVFISSSDDGFKDHRQYYEYGVIDRIEHFDASRSTTIPYKVDFYNSYHKTRSELDTDTDGSADIVRTYNKYEEAL